MKKRLIMLALLCGAGCSGPGDPHEEWVICVNRQCEVHVGVEQLEVCKNIWDADFYDFTTECTTIK